MMNGKQRARWLAEMISEIQRYVSKSKDASECGLVQQALNNLHDARRMAQETPCDE
jgi:hypothetical protein